MATDDQGVVLSDTEFLPEEQHHRRVSITFDSNTHDEGSRLKTNTTHHHKDLLHNGSGHHPPLHSLNPDVNSDVSWWYMLCFKCRQKEAGPGWEPTFWQSFCPYPYCPTYRQVARCFALFLMVVLAWGIVYTVMGDVVAPGGQLFNIALLVICGHFGGYLFRIVNLPGLVGTLAVGVIFQNAGLISIHGEYVLMCGILRRIALVIILTRAGLELDPKAIKRLFGTSIKLGLIPWMVECSVIALACHYFLLLPWIWALLTGGLVAAVSPAVVVPILFRLRTKGYGVAKGIPTIVIAVAGMDDAASVAAFGIVQGLMFSKHSLSYNLTLGVTSLLGGVGCGILWGVLSKFVPEKGDLFVVPMRILLLLGGGLIAVFGSEMLEIEGAGPLAVVTAAFISIWVWTNQGWDIEDNPVSTAFEIFWMLFEPILFSLTGTQIRFNEIDPHIFTVGFASIVTACVIRLLTTVIVATGSCLNTKEKFFVALSWIGKGGVQAALGPVVLDTVLRLGYSTDSPEHGYAKSVMMMCILSIALTVPVGAILITLAGPRLLTKTLPGPPEIRRRTTRPSLWNITVIDEGEEEQDISRRPSRRFSRFSRSSRPSVFTPHDP